jgi:hypothetical protein
MRARQQAAPLVQETGMQVQTFHSSVFHLLATVRHALGLLVAVEELLYAAGLRK